MNALYLSAALTLAAPAIKDKDPGIVGEWTIESTVVGGKVMKNPPEGTTYVFTADGQYTSRKNGVESKSANRGYKIDVSKVPHEYEFESGPIGKTVWVSGIFKVERDTLTICFSSTGKRPTSFDPEKTERLQTITYKRVKK
jgi:uncharacterized protein (TIGR03067 family)